MIKKKLLYTRFEITGLNLDRLINSLKKSGIDIYDVKKAERKKLSLTISSADEKKFFAKTDKTCYNIKRCGNFGVLAPIKYLCRNWGILVGAVVFLLTALIFDNLLLSVGFTGTGSVYGEEVIAYLSDRGIGRFTAFSSFDLDKLADDVLRDFSSFSFVSAKKRGNTLVIDLALSKEAKGAIDTGKRALYSPCDGVVEDIKVYRGTAAVEIGDEIKSGALLVDGYKIIKEKRVDTFVLAVVTVRRRLVFEYETALNDAEDYVLSLAKETFGGEAVKESVEKIPKNGGYLYTAYLDYLTVVE